MFLVVTDDDPDPHAGLKPMNCPGHMLLFGSRLRSYRDLPIRYAESSTLHRNELAGALHGLLRVRHVTQDDAHIFCTEEQAAAEIDACIEFAKDLYALFDVTPHAELSTRPDNRLGTEEEWDHAEGILQAALERHGIEYVISPGEGTFYGPKIDLHMSDAIGRTWQMGTIQARLPDAPAVRPHLHGRRQHRAHADGRPPRPARLAGAVHRHPHRALRGRVPLLARAGTGAADPGRRDPPRRRVQELRQRLAAEGYRVDVDQREETLGKRIREAELEKIPFTIVYGDRESDASLAVRERGGGQSTLSLSELLERFRADLATIRVLKAGADHCPSPSRAPSSRGFNRAGWTRKTWPLLAAVFVVDEEDSTSLVKSL